MSTQMAAISSTARTCFSIFKIKTAEGLQYRMAGIASASTGIFWALIEITVYTVFYHYAARKDAGVMAGLTLKQAVSYVWLAQAFLVMQPMNIDSEILGKINSGDIGIELCRPLDLYFHWFAKLAATRLTPLFWRGSVVLLCGVLMPYSYRLQLPDSATGLLWTAVSMLCAFLLCTAYSVLMCTVRMSITWGDGPTYILMLIGGVLSGGYLPLQLWPESLQRILLLQPFAGYLDIPLRLYLGTMLPNVAIGFVCMQLMWTLFFVLVGKALMARRLRSIIVQGG